MFFVETTRPRVYIQDLAIEVTPTSPQWVSKEDAEGSICLKNLTKMGALRVTYGERGRLNPNRPKARMSRKIQRKVKPAGKVPVSPDKITLTKSELSEMLQQAAEQAARKVTSQPAPPSLNGLEERLENLLRGVLASAPAPASAAGAQTSQQASEGPEEPMFIPKGIVREKSAALDIQKESSDSEDLSEAAAALKKLREKK